MLAQGWDGFSLFIFMKNPKKHKNYQAVGT
jgi:hypothetical protein